MPVPADGDDPMDDEARFADNLRRQREARGWSQGDLARRMQEAGWGNFHQTTVSRIEKGERPIRLGEAKALAEVFRLSLEVLLRPSREAVLVEQLRQFTKDAGRAFTEITESTRGFLNLQKALELLLESADVLENAPVPARDVDYNPTLDYYSRTLRRARATLKLAPEAAVRVGRQEPRGEEVADG